MDLPRLLPCLLTAVILLSAVPCMTEFGWLVFKVDFTVAHGTNLKTAVDSLENTMKRFLSSNIPEGQFKLVVINNATNQKL
ncbi:centromere protein P isoform X2 [Lithobates pipiens]